MSSPIEEAARYLDLDDDQREYLRGLLDEAELRGRLCVRPPDSTSAPGAPCHHGRADEAIVCFSCLMREYAATRPKTVREAVRQIGDLCLRFRLLGLVLTRKGDGTLDMNWANGVSEQLDCRGALSGRTEDDRHTYDTFTVGIRFPTRSSYEELAVMEDSDA